MCGLFGAFGSQIVKSELSFIENLGVLSMFRGKDSTGVFLKSGINSIVIKELVPSTLFFGLNDKYDAAIKAATSFQVVLGHTRAKTIGENTVDNAHPHEYAHIVGVHNGTIGTFRSQAIKEKVSDSFLLFKSIAEEGLDATLNKLDSSDALAIVYYDKKAQTVNVYRNDKRPLHFFLSAGVCYFASTENTLAFNKLHDNIKPTISSFDVNTLYSYDIGSTKATTRELPPLKPAPVFTHYNNRTFFDYGNLGNYYNRNHGTTKTSSKKEKKELEFNWAGARFVRQARKVNIYAVPTKNNPGIIKQVHVPIDVVIKDGYHLPTTHGVLPVRVIIGSNLTTKTAPTSDTSVNDNNKQVYRGYRGGLYSKPSYQNMFPSQCCNCGGTCTENDTVWWTSHDTYYCHDCVSEIPDYLDRYEGGMTIDDVY